MRRISVSAVRPADSTAAMASRADDGSVAATRRAAPACTTITLTWCATTSCSSRAMRARSSATASRARSSRSRSRRAARSCERPHVLAVTLQVRAHDPGDGVLGVHEQQLPGDVRVALHVVLEGEQDAERGQDRRERGRPTSAVGGHRVEGDEDAVVAAGLGVAERAVQTDAHPGHDEDGHGVPASHGQRQGLGKDEDRADRRERTRGGRRRYSGHVAGPGHEEGQGREGQGQRDVGDVLVPTQARPERADLALHAGTLRRAEHHRIIPGADVPPPTG